MIINNKKYKPKFFPFSAGIPWKIDRGKYIIPEINYHTWNNLLINKDITIIVLDGLLESFFSLSVAEVFNKLNAGVSIYWLGDSKYSIFIKLQGLCKPSNLIKNLQITQNTLDQYPVPIFFDKNNNVYFNFLNNYLIKKSYWGKYPKKINDAVLKQLADNITVPWDNYIPRMRNLQSDFFDNLYKIGKISYKSKIICIILNKTDNDVLKWKFNHIKEFAQLASHKRFKVIIFTNNVNIFYGTRMLVYDYNIKNIMQVISKSWVVLSTDINWLLISMMISDTNLISRHVDGPFDLFKNAEFLGINNSIFTDKDWVSPIDAFTICEGLL